MTRHTARGCRGALAVALVSLLAGCSRQIPTEASAESRLALRRNQPVSIEAKSVVANLVRVMNDSRCPVDVTCVTAGNAVVVFTATVGSPSLPVVPPEQFVNTTEEPRGVTYSSFTFRLDSLLPRPLSTHAITQDEYVAYMTVTATK